MRKDSNFKYTGDIVLGMHDALVSLTGLIAGLVGAGADGRAIVLTSVIASIAAGLSMAASNYLAARADNRSCVHAIASGAHTGAAYIATCVILIMPFMLGPDVVHAMIATFVIAGATIFGFNMCMGIITRSYKRFWHRFIEMFLVCVGVSVAAYAIGEFAAQILGINI